MFEPGYIKLHANGKLQEIAHQLAAIYDNCTLCARMCKVNRNKGEKGVCSSGAQVKITSVSPHFGEERPLVGIHGSGTIFLTHCSLLCLYCQNWDISHKGEGDEISDEQLASEMLRLQKIGCHNINFVTPTHYLPNIVQALVYAVEKGLKVPLVYNTGGYDRAEIIKMLEGIIDIYMPDYKYSDGEIAAKYSRSARDYPEIAKAALKEMHRQVGVLQTDENHIAQRGLIIRHLVLPNNLAGTEEFVKFVAEELDPGTYVNIMAQYRPCYQAYQYPELSRGLTAREFQNALLIARHHKLYNLD
ncbi:MAG: radical SAM protein [Candidatus Aminicenantes bacterium]|nr:MAG: radical SAM protein [Candidatus Aminicenantes bacterium]